jgi:RNA polymerase sigma-70 factor, ECF subfamily
LNPTVAGAPDSKFCRQLAQSRSGNPDVFGRLLDGFREYLLAVANVELDAEVRARVGPSDAVQETFKQAARRFETFSGSTDPELRAWLRMILVNRCRNLRDEHVNAAKRDARREIDIGEANSDPGLARYLVADEPTPSKHAAAAEDAARLLTALSLLPEDFRQVVWLRNWEGLSFDEIGARTGRSREAVRKIFSRAVEKLARVLEATDGEHATRDE